jgi:hypothetical protein
MSERKARETRKTTIKRNGRSPKAERVLKLLGPEAIAFNGLLAREREIQEKMIEPLIRDRAELFGGIEARLGLQSGALGTTHTVDLETRRVDPREQPPD